MTNKNNAITLKDWAYLAIAKNSHQIFEREGEVLEDRDPENLHQMRVSVKKLKSAIAGFAIALDLPEIVTEKNITRLDHSLGKLRDLDVLLHVLNQDYQPLLAQSEQKILNKVLKSLNKQRSKELNLVRKTLNSQFYFDIQRGLQNWLEQPKYKPIGNCLIDFVLPDLLLNQVSQLLLHPGWLVGVEFAEGAIIPPQMLNQEAVALILTNQDSSLHSLCKLVKKTRYNLELFSQLYGKTYHDYVDLIKRIQQVLGQIQDFYVLKKFLEQSLKSAIAIKMPDLATHLL
ncbi:MAG: CHAD domain-containing protein, partial [Pleurocapsa sp.]